LRFSLVAVAISLLAGCGDEPTVTVDALPSLVLQPADLPGFARFAEGRQSGVGGPGERGDPRRFGRQGGWHARYRRLGPQNVRGPLVVESTADVFRDADGAARDLAAWRRLAASERPLPVPQVGTESVGSTTRQDSLAGAVRFYRIAFSTANATGSVTVQGLDGRLSVTDATRLAHAQQRRIEAEAR
jgi:hypothetical protein